MAEHDLKVWPGYFDAIDAGEKPFEVRKNDRGYQVGDKLRLREYAPGPDEYTGREIERTVSYLISGDTVEGYAFGLRTGFVVMGLR
jgi:hypothetical protein